jgi:hypothetical protein
MSINIKTVSEDFWTARARGEFFPQAYFDRLTLDEAYRIQLALIDRRSPPASARSAGRSA